MLLGNSQAWSYCIKLQNAYSAHISIQSTDFGSYLCPERIAGRKGSGPDPRPPLPFVTRMCLCLSHLWAAGSWHCCMFFLLSWSSSRYCIAPWSQNSSFASSFGFCALFQGQLEKESSHLLFFPIPHPLHSSTMCTVSVPIALKCFVSLLACLLACLSVCFLEGPCLILFKGPDILGCPQLVPCLISLQHASWAETASRSLQCSPTCWSSQMKLQNLGTFVRLLVFISSFM